MVFMEDILFEDLGERILLKLRELNHILDQLKEKIEVENQNKNK